jgi:myosin heavy subunit
VAITTFEPINIDKYLEKSKEQLSKSLTILNTFMQQLTDNNTELVKQKDEYKRLLDKKAIEIVNLQEKIRELENKQKNIIQFYEEKEEELKRRIKTMEKNNSDMEDIVKLLWDEEAESLLKKQHIFEEDNITINENRVVTDLNDDLDIIKKESRKLENEYKNRLKGLF